MFETVNFELVILAQLLLASFLGGAIGYERRVDHQEAGVRTHALVAFGAALFSLISLYGFVNAPVPAAIDLSRIMSKVVTGVGFLGAGLIIFTGDRVHGLTTAAGLWVCAAIGMAVAVGWYIVAIVGTVIALVILYVLRRFFPSIMDQVVVEEKPTRS